MKVLLKLLLLLLVCFGCETLNAQPRSYYQDRLRRPSNPPMPPLLPDRERLMPHAPRPIGPGVPVQDFRNLMVERERLRTQILHTRFSERMANLRSVIAAAEEGAAEASAMFQENSQLARALGLTAADGLLHEKDIATPEMRAFRREIALRTTPFSEEGLAVRDVVNRGLAGLRADSTPMQTSEIWGALSLAVGADQAYADGKKDVGDFLAESGLSAVDLTFGLTPVAGSINDLLQIAVGLITGDDYTGDPMGTTDYVTRGIGVVLGILPGGRPVVRLGTEYIDRAWLSGGLSSIELV